VKQVTESARPLRADAARNRARVLEVAYEVFAAEGLGVPIDEIARRAGVGAGTVYRHFPTKEDLYRAVIEDHINRIIDDGRQVLASGEPGEALFTFLQSMVLEWGATDRGLAEALAGIGIALEDAVPDKEEVFLTLLEDLLRAAQKAGTVQRDVDVRDVKAIVVGMLAMQGYRPETAERLTKVVLDGLRVG
jgi:AcrR family transcriptional regulator